MLLQGFENLWPIIGGNAGTVDKTRAISNDILNSGQFPTLACQFGQFTHYCEFGSRVYCCFKWPTCKATVLAFLSSCHLKSHIAIWCNCESVQEIERNI